MVLGSGGGDAMRVAAPVASGGTKPKRAAGRGECRSSSLLSEVASVTEVDDVCPTEFSSSSDESAVSVDDVPW